MLPSKYLRQQKRPGVVLVISMIFLLIFSSLAVSMATLSGDSVQIANNQHKINSAYCAAQSGLQTAKYLLATVTLDSTIYNTVSQSEADNAWSDFCDHVNNNAPGNASVTGPVSFSYSGGGQRLTFGPVNFGTDSDFTVTFERYTSNPLEIRIQATGVDGQVTRSVAIDTEITKDRAVLDYAVASRGRMWLTGDSTIHGDIFSSWDRPEISPFNTTSETAVEGTFNTVLSHQDIEDEGYQLETLDGNDPLFYFNQTVYDSQGNAVGDVFGKMDDNYNLTDVNGSPVFDANGSRIPVDYNDRLYSTGDEIQGYHEGVNYEQPDHTNMPGMDISDYDTQHYKSWIMGWDLETGEEGGNGIIPRADDNITVEYFPHAPNDYGTASSDDSKELHRHTYNNETFSDQRLPGGRDALFKNCTFEGILYVDTYSYDDYSTNNVRFENCQFNGVIITSTPSSLDWKGNCLYFTDEATFDNQSSIQEATILGPHFNVDLGNTNPQQSDNNVLKGAVIGGIVDVRGNAQINGTIISMCDTTQWSSGYVTNIGATLDDGGSETTELGDAGTIHITPDPDRMLPSGIVSAIVINPKQQTYREGL